MNNEGYIYIYKCIVGTSSEVCKVGKTKNLFNSRNRMAQHLRTPYYGFIPYCHFESGNVITTAFYVKDHHLSDNLVKAKLLDKQVFDIEIYNIDYNEVIKVIYDELVLNDQFISLHKDGISDYSLLEDEEVLEEVNISTKKKDFELLRDKILDKYETLPEELLIILRDEEEFATNVSSHYNNGNYIEFGDNLVLDINFDKIKKIELKYKLESLLNR